MTSSEKSRKAAPKAPRVFAPETQRKRDKALQNKRSRIMNAALSLFASQGVSGTTVEQIAEQAAVSKSNLLYYFSSKEKLYLDVIKQLLDVWLSPLQRFSSDQNALDTLTGYIRVKLEMSRDNPAESKLFCLEVVQGAPLLLNELASPLCKLMEAKVQVINDWIAQGQLRPTDPYHLIFSIWAITQHYADFSVQIRAITGKELTDKAFFDATLHNITAMITDGIRP